MTSRIAALIKAHQGQPFATANCTQCHDPHQSAQPKLMARFTHPPFAEKTCETCHAPSERRQSRADAMPTSGRCASPATAIKAEKIEKAKVQHPGARVIASPAITRMPAQPGISATRSGEHLPGLPHRSGGSVQEGAPASAGVQARVRDLPRAARRRQRTPARAKKTERSLPGMSRARSPAEKAGSRASDHDFQWQREASRGLLHEEQGCRAAAEIWPGASDRRAIRFPMSSIRRDITKVQSKDQLPVLPPAACVGAARSAGEGPGQQPGVLFHVP